jgi:hypothetical protein
MYSPTCRLFPLVCQEIREDNHAVAPTPWTGNSSRFDEEELTSLARHRKLIHIPVRLPRGRMGQI